MKTWKVALVGCGDIAMQVYLPYLPKIPRVELAAVCDIIPERAKAYAEKFNAPAWYPDVDSLLRDCDFDILMDTATIQSHYEINMKALKAGKHLYSQKPVGLRVAEVDDMIAAAEASRVKFAASPIHMLRPDIRIAKRLIADGAIGAVSMIRCTISHGGPEYFQFRQVDPTWFYREGAGALYDMGVHGLHMVTGLLGPAKAVTCIAATSEPLRTVRSGSHNGKQIRSDEMPDNYLINLEFSDKTIGIVDTGYIMKAGKTPSLEIYGSAGTISFTGNKDEPLQVYIDSPDKGLRGWMAPFPYHNVPEEFFQCLCIRDLINAIEGDVETGLPPAHARHVVEIMCAIPQSIQEEKKVRLQTTF